MSTTYALVDQNNKVINVIHWDGKPPWYPPAGCTAVAVPEDSLAGIDWLYVDGQFVPPSEPDPVSLPAASQTITEEI